MENETLLEPKAAASMLNLSTARLRQLDHVLRPIRATSGRRMYRREVVEAFAARRGIDPRAAVLRVQVAHGLAELRVAELTLGVAAEPPSTRDHALLLAPSLSADASMALLWRCRTAAAGLEIELGLSCPGCHVHGRHELLPGDGTSAYAVRCCACSNTRRAEIVERGGCRVIVPVSE